MLSSRRTMLQGQGEEVPSSHSQSLPLKQAVSRLRRSCVMLCPSRQCCGCPSVGDSSVQRS